MNRDLLEDEQRRKEKEQSIPLRRIGHPEEIAKVALFLAQVMQVILQVQQYMSMEV